jgi:hypothetical protein
VTNVVSWRPPARGGAGRTGRPGCEHPGMRVAAVLLAVVAVGFMAAAIRDMVLESGDARRGLLLRIAAVACFAAAVALNVLAG